MEKALRVFGTIDKYENVRRCSHRKTFYQKIKISKVKHVVELGEVNNYRIHLTSIFLGIRFG